MYKDGLGVFYTHTHRDMYGNAHWYTLCSSPKFVHSITYSDAWTTINAAVSCLEESHIIGKKCVKNNKLNLVPREKEKKR